MHLPVQTDDDGRRLDRIIRRALPELPLSAIHRFFRQGRILLDGVPAGPDSRVRAGQVIGAGKEHHKAEDYLEFLQMIDKKCEAGKNTAYQSGYLFDP